LTDEEPLSMLERQLRKKLRNQRNCQQPSSWLLIPYSSKERKTRWVTHIESIHCNKKGGL
jgi:hypothetical protein